MDGGNCDGISALEKKKFSEAMVNLPSALPDVVEVPGGQVAALVKANGANKEVFELEVVVMVLTKKRPRSRTLRRR